jgi:hypothetical protein
LNHFILLYLCVFKPPTLPNKDEKSKSTLVIDMDIPNAPVNEIHPFNVGTKRQQSNSGQNNNSNINKNLKKTSASKGTNLNKKSKSNETDNQVVISPSKIKSRKSVDDDINLTNPKLNDAEVVSTKTEAMEISS